MMSSISADSRRFGAGTCGGRLASRSGKSRFPEKSRIPYQLEGGGRYWAELEEGRERPRRYLKRCSTPANPKASGQIPLLIHKTPVLGRSVNRG